MILAIAFSVFISLYFPSLWNYLSGDITTAAILHLASMVPKKLQFSATDFNSYNTVSSGLFLSPTKDGVRTSNGQKMSVPKSHPGLGVEPNWKVLGEPLFAIEWIIKMPGMPIGILIIVC